MTNSTASATTTTNDSCKAEVLALLAQIARTDEALESLKRFVDDLAAAENDD